MSTSSSFTFDKETILLIALSVLIGLLAIQWVMWLFRLGRFANKKEDDTNGLVFIVADFFVKVINDFKHLLALVVILVFAGVLIYSVVHAASLDENVKNVDNLADALQAVVASLGGIVGSIIGYYFGESAGRNKSNSLAEVETPSQSLLDQDEIDDVDIELPENS